MKTAVYLHILVWGMSENRKMHVADRKRCGVDGGGDGELERGAHVRRP